MRNWLVLAATALSLSGCLTPSSGPQATMIYEHATDGSGRLSYELIEIDTSILDLFRMRTQPTLVGRFGNERVGPTDVKLGVGDLIGMSIFEASAGGLFTPASTDTLRQGNYVALPQQVVDNDGTLSVPFAGRIAVAGKSSKQVEAEAVNRLKDRAIEPQVLISLIESRSSLYSVFGDVHAPNRFPVNWAGERITAGIARAGGPVFPDYEESVTLSRSGKTATVMLDAIVRNPREDIYLRPGDSIYLRHEPRFFTALGAAGRSGQYPIDVPRLTLAEAVGRAQGLLDTQADPTGVFVLRWEDPRILERMGRDISAYGTKRIPTIYHIDLQNPKLLLASQQIDVLDKDVVYVTNAPTVEFMKSLVVLNELSSIYLNISAIKPWF
ncbi:polysaccharide biosynthesis/export family protein [Methylocystis heyeri]|uniref:Polysaccharide export protein n=1 Tax=Methylocystis heyeri TaxID=391905 RepID=A0A6B8KBN6_9HYPH|nr:polysaccharide biosynthesis/export family protein [Methylocystis heyeri]QGM44441.1 polysaccharide export protein [Methylocystis heyeri]